MPAFETFFAAIGPLFLPLLFSLRKRQLKTGDVEMPFRIG
jgi:hypothetical protein